MERPTRRELLRSGGPAGVAVLSAGAGCLGFLSGGGDGTAGTNGTNGTNGTGNGPGANGNTTPGGDGTTTTPQGPADVTAFRSWLPTPEDLYGDARYTFFYNDVSGFREHSGTVPAETLDRVKRYTRSPVSALGVAPESVDQVLQVGTSGNVVVGGSFGRASLGEGLSSKGYSKSESYHGFDLYAGGENPPAVAVGEGTAALCREVDEKPVAVARLLIDAARGEATRYHEASEAFDLVSKDLPGATRAGGTLMEEVTDPAPKKGRFKGQVGLGFGFTVGADTTDLTMVVVFKDEATARRGPVETWAVEGLTGLLQYNDHQVSQQGRTVRIVGNVDTARVDFLREGNPGERSDGDEETLDALAPD